MTRDELDQLMLIYAAGAADATESALAEEWLGRNDPAAEAAYAEAQSILASMAMAVSRVEPPAHVRDRLLSRVAADISGSTTSSTQPPATQRSSAATQDTTSTSWWRTRAPLGIAAALLIGLIASLLLLQRVARERDQLAAGSRNMQQQVRTVQELMASPHVNLVKFDGQQGAYGRVLYCPVRNEYRISVFHMSAPPAGRVYELWLITPDQKKMPMGILTLDQRGNGELTAQVPPKMPVVLAAITDEPPGGSQSPTGAIHLSGTITPQQ